MCRHVNPGSASRCRECGEPNRKSKVAAASYKIPSSSGGEYTVSEKNGVWACECDGYEVLSWFRKTCRHIDTAKKGKV